MSNVLNISIFEKSADLCSSQASRYPKCGKLYWRKVPREALEEKKEPCPPTLSCTTSIQTARLAETIFAANDTALPAASTTNQEMGKIAQLLPEQFKKLAPQAQQEFSLATDLTHELISKFREVVVTPCYSGTIESHRLATLMLPYLSHMTKIHLLCSEVTDNDLEALTQRARVTQFKEIDFRECYGYTQPKLQAFLKSCTKLAHVTLQKCSSIDDSVIKVLARPSRPLESLNLSGTQITGKVLIPLVRRSRKLQRIDFSDCPKIRNKAIRTFTTYCAKHKRQFQEIYFAGCSQIAPQLLLKLVKLCPQQKIVYFSDCAQITDKTLEILFLSSPQIKGLTLENCSKITEKGLQVVERYSPQLDVIAFPHALGDTPTGRRLIKFFEEPEITPEWT
jgi:hypothetical protein